jgi:hypothetical protein
MCGRPINIINTSFGNCEASKDGGIFFFIFDWVFFLTG